MPRNDLDVFGLALLGPKGHRAVVNLTDLAKAQNPPPLLYAAVLPACLPELVSELLVHSVFQPLLILPFQETEVHKTCLFDLGLYGCVSSSTEAKASHCGKHCPISEMLSGSLNLVHTSCDGSVTIGDA